MTTQGIEFIKVEPVQNTATTQSESGMPKFGEADTAAGVLTNDTGNVFSVTLTSTDGYVRYIWPQPPGSSVSIQAGFHVYLLQVDNNTNNIIRCSYQSSTIDAVYYSKSATIVAGTTHYVSQL